MSSACAVSAWWRNPPRFRCCMGSDACGRRRYRSGVVAFACVATAACGGDRAWLGRCGRVGGSAAGVGRACQGDSDRCWIVWYYVSDIVRWRGSDRDRIVLVAPERDRDGDPCWDRHHRVCFAAGLEFVGVTTPPRPNKCLSLRTATATNPTSPRHPRCHGSPHHNARRYRPDQDRCDVRRPT